MKDGKLVREWSKLAHIWHMCISMCVCVCVNTYIMLLFSLAVDLKNPPGKVYQGQPSNKNKPSVTVTVADNNLMEIASGQLNAQQVWKYH